MARQCDRCVSIVVVVVVVVVALRRGATPMRVRACVHVCACVTRVVAVALFYILLLH